MNIEHVGQIEVLRTEPRNKGKLTGAKPPLQPKHVWAIRTRLQIAGRIRDLALFNLAIDSKLRGCDLVSIAIEDVAPHGYAVNRATIRQRKTGRPVRFEITEQTRQAVDDLLAALRSEPRGYLFRGQRRGGHLTTRQYARLLGEWLSMIGLDPSARADMCKNAGRLLAKDAPDRLQALTLLPTLPELRALRRGKTNSTILPPHRPRSTPSF